MANMVEVRGQFGGASYAPSLAAERSPQANSLSLGQRLSIFTEAVGNKGRVVALAAVLAACQGSPATPSPTRTPDATPTLGPTPTATYEPTPSLAPTPTITLEPTPVITPTPTTEPTNSPEPTDAPVTLNSFIDQLLAEGEANGFPDVSINELKNIFKDAFEEDPEAAEKMPYPDSPRTLSEYVDQSLDRCKTGDAPYVDPDQGRMLGCGALGTNAWIGYDVNENPIFLDALRMTINHIENHVRPDLVDDAIESIRLSE